MKNEYIQIDFAYLLFHHLLPPHFKRILLLICLSSCYFPKLSIKLVVKKDSRENTIRINECMKPLSVQKMYWSFISFVDFVQIDIAVLSFFKREFHKTSWNDCYNFICSVFITIKQVKPDFFCHRKLFVRWYNKWLHYEHSNVGRMK